MNFGGTLTASGRSRRESICGSTTGGSWLKAAREISKRSAEKRNLFMILCGFLLAFYINNYATECWKSGNFGQKCVGKMEKMSQNVLEKWKF
jgi:hypothetical protein